MDGAGVETQRTATIASSLNTICCDRISLTYKTASRILKPRKSKFLSNQLAMNLILNRSHGRLVSLWNGRYDDVPIDVVTSVKKVMDIEKSYNCHRLCPYYESFESKPLFIMASDY